MTDLDYLRVGGSVLFFFLVIAVALVLFSDRTPRPRL